jgi:hypothetical protein
MYTPIIDQDALKRAMAKLSGDRDPGSAPASSSSFFNDSLNVGVLLMLARGHGLTLVDFSAQPEPRLVPEATASVHLTA